ncbi:hypothetical protein Z945_2058 [Sulfitobacter noctilucae]|nr:hypothetical protein Z945_2058 [Sulfitobacter noctilucae]
MFVPGLLCPFAALGISSLSDWPRLLVRPFLRSCGCGSYGGVNLLFLFVIFPVDRIELLS